jgi:hypothetical protein
MSAFTIFGVFLLGVFLGGTLGVLLVCILQMAREEEQIDVSKWPIPTDGRDKNQEWPGQW